MSHKKILNYLMPKYLKQSIMLAVALFVTVFSYAQDSLRTEKINIISSNNKDRIVDEEIASELITIDTTISKKAIKNIIISSLFTTNVTDQKMEEVDKYSEFSGLIIDSIFIVKARPFEPNNAEDRFTKFLYRTANSIHKITNSSIIEKGLLFEPGERIKSQNIDNSIALLRNSGIFSSVDIYLEPSATNSNMVNVYVITQDNLSISVGGSYRYSSNADIFIKDDNFLGMGNSLTFKYFVNVKDRDWARGGELGYDMRNIGGKYINASSALGIGDNTFLFRFMTEKLFIKDGDYAFGAGYTAIRSDDGYFSFTENLVTQNQNAKLWGGKAFTINEYNNNIYFNIGAYYVNYSVRPEVSATLNPLFHNNLDFIGTVGFYREKFYDGNLIYGYGRTETIPYGYTLETIGGFRKGEFENTPYVGINFKMGNLIKIGYLKGGISLGTFLAPESPKAQSSIAKISLNYFTNLIEMTSGYYLRQFFNVGYTTGVNMLLGERTTMKFNNKYELANVSGQVQGHTRLEANAESVLFTPLHVYGFRFAFFGFIDCGTLGLRSHNPFKNQFYGITGIGVRVRNESLVFRTLQIRVGIALRSSPSWRNDLYQITTQSKLQGENFKPQQPSYIPFR